MRRLKARLEDVEILDPVGPEEFSKQQAAKQAPKRTRERKTTVVTALTTFRHSYWRAHYRYSGFPPQTVLPDNVLNTLATETKIKTLADLKELLPGWHFADDLGPGALDCIDKADSLWTDDNEAEKKKRSDARKAETARLKPLKQEEERVRRGQEREATRIANGGQPRPVPGTWEIQTPSGSGVVVSDSRYVQAQPFPATPLTPLPVQRYNLPLFQPRVSLAFPPTPVMSPPVQHPNNLPTPSTPYSQTMYPWLHAHRPPLTPVLPPNSNPGLPTPPPTAIAMPSTPWYNHTMAWYPSPSVYSSNFVNSHTLPESPPTVAASHTTLDDPFAYPEHSDSHQHEN